MCILSRPQKLLKFLFLQRMFFALKLKDIIFDSYFNPRILLFFLGLYIELFFINFTFPLKYTFKETSTYLLYLEILSRWWLIFQSILLSQCNFLLLFNQTKIIDFFLDCSDTKKIRSSSLLTILYRFTFFLA